MGPRSLNKTLLCGVRLYLQSWSKYQLLRKYCKAVLWNLSPVLKPGIAIKRVFYIWRLDLCSGQLLPCPFNLSPKSYMQDRIQNPFSTRLLFLGLDSDLVDSNNGKRIDNHIDLVCLYIFIWDVCMCAYIHAYTHTYTRMCSYAYKPFF